jgi:phytoene dehydrogenase-like protein
MSIANAKSNGQPDLIVIGGGIAGLTAAALVARAGRSVVVLEQSSNLGGRAATQTRQGVHFNLGAHALYRRGRAYRVLTELGVAFSGNAPPTGKALVFHKDKPYRLPQGPLSLFFSGLLTVGEKWRMAGLLSGFQKIDASRFDSVTVSDWVRQTAGTGMLAELLFTLFRLSTYVNDPERLSAGAAIRQLQMALVASVLYLDGGWQTLVEGLRLKASENGARIRTGTGVESVRSDRGCVTIQLSGGETVQSRTAILAVPPNVVSELLGRSASDPLACRLSRCLPVRAACLDVALRKLPRPAARFALGLDKPLYYSVHSAAAKLAPDGIAVIQLMKYLGNDTSGPEKIEQEMASLLSLQQPGWRDLIVTKRFLPNMTVVYDFPRADAGGLSGRVGVKAGESVFLAGDWVGAEGMLADASLASAEEAARQAIAALSTVPANPLRSPSHVNN